MSIDINFSTQMFFQKHQESYEHILLQSSVCVNLEFDEICVKALARSLEGPF